MSSKRCVSAPTIASEPPTRSGVVRVCARGVIGEVAHLDDLGHLGRDHGLHTFEHRLAAHRASMTTATHREVRGALPIVTGKGDEPAMGRECRVDLGRHHCLHLGRDLVVRHETLDHGGLGLVGVANEETLPLVVVDDRTLESLEVLGWHDDLQAIDRAHLVAEGGLREEVEREVITKIFARLRDDLETQAELTALHLGIAKFEEFDVCLGRDRDDRVGRNRRRRSEGAGCHAVRIPTPASAAPSRDTLRFVRTGSPLVRRAERVAAATDPHT